MLLGLSARSFFRDPVAFVRANGVGHGVLRIGAGRNRFTLLRDRQAIWQVLVEGRGSFEPGKWKRKSRRFVGDALLGLGGAEHRRSAATRTRPRSERPPAPRGPGAGVPRRGDGV